MTADSLTGQGRQFVDELESQLGGAPVEQFAPYAADAAQVLLLAIAPSPERADIVKRLTQVEVDKGVTGPFTITPTGDPSRGPISILVAKDRFQLEDTVTPPADLVTAARQG